MEKIPFIKMQATGNDFVLIDNRNGLISGTEYSRLAKSVSDRKFGVGSDGLILLQEGKVEGTDLEMIYKNPDGSDAGMCGNGARCFVRMASNLGFDMNRISFHVHKNVYTGKINDENIEIQFPLDTYPEELKIDGDSYLSVYTNTEHIVCQLSASDLTDNPSLVQKGRKLRHHPLFAPIGTNVNFIHGFSDKQLVLQTYERGVEDLTLACGTGAIASAVAWHSYQQLPEGDYIIKVKTKGGTLIVYFTFHSSNKIYNNIRLEGPAVTVFEGTYLY